MYFAPNALLAGVTAHVHGWALTPSEVQLCVLQRTAFVFIHFFFFTCSFSYDFYLVYKALFCGNLLPYCSTLCNC